MEVLCSIYRGFSKLAEGSEHARSLQEAIIGINDAAVDDLDNVDFDTSQLSRYVNELVKLLPISHGKSFKKHLFRSIAQDNNIDNLRAMKLKGDTEPSSSEIGAAACLKLMYSFVETASESSPLQHIFPKSATVVITQPIGEYFSLGEYLPQMGANSIPVFIEWRPINSPSQDISSELLHRIDGLAGALGVHPKPTAMHVLDYLGFYLDRVDRRYGLVFQYPSGPASKPLSLFELIKSTPEPKNHDIALTYRFDVARSLVSCILYCHSIGWLHERISSHNILFFHPLSTLKKARQLPFLVGFNHSRQDQEQAFSHGPPTDPALLCYLHPTYSTAKFQKLYDYYSVGLVLLEIGLWRTISSIQQDNPFDDQFDLTQTILKKHLQEVRYRMGDIYATVVKVCLDLSTQAESDLYGDAEDRFQRLVVDSLDMCVL